MRRIAFFDFDLTLTTKDSFGVFIRHCFENQKFLLVFKTLKAIPFVFLWKIGVLSNSKSKELVFSAYFKGMPELLFMQKCSSFGKEKIPSIINPRALDCLKGHLSDGDSVTIVSASMHDYLVEWSNGIGVSVLATGVEVNSGFVTGRFSTPNCTGAEKVTRIKEVYDLSVYDEIFAYGDSDGDTEMLAIATKGYYRKF